jgi:hypothetical protein
MWHVFLYRWAGICITLEICGYKCNFMWRFFVTLCGKPALKGAYPPTESNRVESYPQRRGTLLYNGRAQQCVDTSRFRLSRVPGVLPSQDKMLHVSVSSA